MPRVQCPVEGFEEIYVTYPDEWQMLHVDKYWIGFHLAPDGCAPFTQQVYATAALIDKIEGLDFDELAGLPLHYYEVFRWLVDEVLGSYNAARQVPKN